MLGNMYVSGALYRVKIAEYSQDNPGELPGASPPFPIRDSKKIMPKKREYLMKWMAANPLFEFATVRYTPREIDATNLNQLTKRAHVSLVNSLKPDVVILDCPVADCDKYARELKRHLNGNPRIICENKADERHKLVGAASIHAKVCRDRHIVAIARDLNCDIGSGYPADVRTVNYIKKNRQSAHIRKKWKISF